MKERNLLMFGISDMQYKGIPKVQELLGDPEIYNTVDVGNFPTGIEEKAVLHAIVYALQKDEGTVTQWLTKHWDAIVPYTKSQAAYLLEKAAQYGNMRLMRQCLQGASHADINCALHAAIKGGHLEAVKLACIYGADPQALIDGDNALMLAAAFGKTDIMQVLLATNINLQALSDVESNPLIAAASRGQTEMITFLRQNGFDLQQALVDVTKKGDLGAAKALCQAGADPFQPCLKGVCAFNIAIETKQDAMALFFLNADSNVGKCEQITQQVSQFFELIEKATSGSEETISACLKKIPSLVKIRDQRGCTALHLALLLGHSKLIEILLESGAEINARLPHGGTYLHSAAAVGNCDLLKRLIKYGIDVHDAGDTHGNTALHVAAIKDESSIFPLLMNSGARIDVRNRFNLTPLHYAAHSEYNGKTTLQEMVTTLSMNLTTRQFLELPLDIYFSQAQDCLHLNPLILSSLGTAFIEKLGKISNTKLSEISDILKTMPGRDRAHVLSCMTLATVALYDLDVNDPDGVGERLVGLLKVVNLTNEDTQLFIEEISKVDGNGVKVKSFSQGSVVGRISVLGNMKQFDRLPPVTKVFLKTLGWLESKRFKELNK
jgi:ankyrin repeat protein